jgi:hypothetical protein
VKLYGLWQTQEWVAPAAAGGKVPKNERGNVEVPPLTKSLPTGESGRCERRMAPAGGEGSAGVWGGQGDQLQQLITMH